MVLLSKLLLCDFSLPTIPVQYPIMIQSCTSNNEISGEYSMKVEAILTVRQLSCLPFYPSVDDDRFVVLTSFIISRINQSSKQAEQAAVDTIGNYILRSTRQNKIWWRRLLNLGSEPGEDTFSTELRTTRGQRSLQVDVVNGADPLGREEKTRLLLGSSRQLSVTLSIHINQSTDRSIDRANPSFSKESPFFLPFAKNKHHNNTIESVCSTELIFRVCTIYLSICLSIIESKQASNDWLIERVLEHRLLLQEVRFGVTCLHRNVYIFSDLEAEF